MGKNNKELAKLRRKLRLRVVNKVQVDPNSLPAPLTLMNHSLLLC